VQCYKYTYKYAYKLTYCVEMDEAPAGALTMCNATYAKQHM